MANSHPPAENGQSAMAPSAPTLIHDSRISGPVLVITVVILTPHRGGLFGKYCLRKSQFLSFFWTTQSSGLSTAFWRSGSSHLSTALAPTASCSFEGFMNSGMSFWVRALISSGPNGAAQGSPISLHMA